MLLLPAAAPSTVCLREGAVWAVAPLAASGRVRMGMMVPGGEKRGISARE